MKAISMWQPWASLFVLPDVKRYETRHWFTTHRGPLLIHAAKRLESDCGAELDEIIIARFGPHWRRELPRGALIGAVEIVHCLPTHHLDPDEQERLCGNFAPARYGWEKSRAMAFETPIPYRGKQGFFNVPPEGLSEALLFAASSPGRAQELFDLREQHGHFGSGHS